MGNSEINKLLHERLYTHEVSMDHDALWNAIQKKKNNKFPIIMLLSSLLVLVFSMSFFAFTFEEIPSKAEFSTELSSLVESDLSTSESVLATKHVISTEPAKDKLKLETPPFTSDQRSTNKIKTTHQSAEKMVVNIKNTNSSNTIKKANSNLSATKFSSFALAVQNTQPAIENTSLLANSAIKEKASATTNNIGQESDTRHPSLLEISLLSYKPMLLNESWGEKMLSRRNKKTGCFDHKIRRNNIGIEIYGGPGVISKKMITSAADYKELLEKRKETETSLESLRGGFAVRFNHNSGVYLKAGLEVGRLRERLDFSVGQDTSYTLENQIIDWEINTNGDSIPIFGTQTVTISSQKSWKVFNEFTTFDVPVLIGYQQAFGNWGVYGEAGAIFNLSLTKDGMILDGNPTPSELEPFFQSQNGIHLTAGFGVSYKITDKVYVFASPNAKWSMSDFNDENYPIDQRFHSYSILFGVGYEFSKGPKTL